MRAWASGCLLLCGCLLAILVVVFCPPGANAATLDVVPISLEAVAGPSDPDWVDISDDIDLETGDAVVGESALPLPSPDIAELSSPVRTAPCYLLVWDGTATRAGPTTPQHIA